MTRLGPVAWPFLLLAMLAGCASPDPRLHTLVAQAGRPGATSARVIAVRRIAIPHYLQREEIVRMKSAEQSVAADNDWWSEPLGVMTTRVFVADLASILPFAEVLTDDEATGLRPDVSITVMLEQFDLAASGQVTLTGLATLTAAAAHPARLLHLHVTVPARGDSIKDQVGAMSEALAGAASDVARQLQRAKSN